MKIVKKICFFVLLFCVSLLSACKKNFEFNEYTTLIVNKDYVLSEYPTYTTIKLTKEQQDEIFDLINDLVVVKEKNLSLDIKGYIYQIIIDQNELNFINAEFVYYENILYKMINGNNELILYLTNLH